MMYGTIAAVATKIQVWCEHAAIVDRKPSDGVGRLLAACAVMVLAVWPALIVLAAAAAPFKLTGHLAARRRRNRGRGCRCYLCDVTRISIANHIVSGEGVGAQNDACDVKPTPGPTPNTTEDGA